MSNWIIYGIGFLAQLLFSSRILLQWIASERNKKVLAPHLFWEISLFASVLLFIYGYLIIAVGLYAHRKEDEWGYQAIDKAMSEGLELMDLPEEER